MMADQPQPSVATGYPEQWASLPVMSPIPTLSAFGFVVAVYDYTDPDDLSPAMAKRHAVGFVPWGWVHAKQTWRRLSRLEDTEQEARAIAERHHEKQARALSAEDHETDLIEHAPEAGEE